jgi:hypothetical protein
MDSQVLDALVLVGIGFLCIAPGCKFGANALKKIIPTSVKAWVDNVLFYKPFVTGIIILAVAGILFIWGSFLTFVGYWMLLTKIFLNAIKVPIF